MYIRSTGGGKLRRLDRSVGPPFEYLKIKDRANVLFISTAIFVKVNIINLTRRCTLNDYNDLPYL